MTAYTQEKLHFNAQNAARNTKPETTNIIKRSHGHPPTTFRALMKILQKLHTYRFMLGRMICNLQSTKFRLKTLNVNIGIYRTR